MREPVHMIGEPATESDQATGRRFKALGKWLTQPEYDPEKGSRADDFNVSIPDFAKRFGLTKTINSESAITVPGLGGPFIANEVSGTFMHPVPKGKRWKPVAIASRADLEAFNASDDGHLKRSMESFGNIDTDVDRNPLSDNTSLLNTEFVPLMNGPFYKQLYIYDYLYMHARAFQLVNHNALAAAAVKQLTRFTLGRGVSFHIKNEEARDVWDEFWERNNMRVRLRQMARDLTWQGELMLRYYEKQRGYMTMRVADPSTCWEIVTDPEDIDHVYYYHLHWPAPYQIYGTGKIPVTRYIVQQVPPTNMQHLKINASSMEKRGRSDLLPGMAWLKRFDDYYNGETLKKVLEANLVWTVKIKGDQSYVDAFQTNSQLTQLPPPGGIWIENEAVDLQATSAQMSTSRGAIGIGGEIASIVATSLNLPAEYFNIGGGSGGSARATALVRTDPAVKTIEDRQQQLRETIEEMYDRVVSAALAVGRISARAARHEPETVADGNQLDRA